VMQGEWEGPRRQNLNAMSVAIGPKFR
jgi:hypothetical protein